MTPDSSSARDSASPAAPTPRHASTSEVAYFTLHTVAFAREKPAKIPKVKVKVKVGYLL